jgi:transcriptional regulator with XRE-family HTH domain
MHPVVAMRRVPASRDVHAWREWGTTGARGCDAAGAGQPRRPCMARVGDYRSPGRAGSPRAKGRVSRDRQNAAVQRDVVADLGVLVRRTRIGQGRRQRDVADAAQVSQSMVSRVELGRGGSVPLATWVRITEALGMVLGEVDRGDRRRDEVQRRCHRLVVERSRLGGWTATTSIDTERPEASETILERHGRSEAAIVHVWDVLADFDRAIADLRLRIEAEQSARGEAWSVSGFVIIARSGHIVRRLSESGRAVDRTFPVRGSRWLGALGGDVPMPASLGMIWTDQSTSRLRPFIRYLDHRRRMRRPRPAA